MLVITCVLLGLLVPAKSTMEGFIVGGKPARMLRHPHSVYLKITCNSGTWSCGGSILNQLFILTAGHCFEGCTDSHNIRIAVGHVNNMKGKRYKAIKFKVHEKYTSEPCMYDIAVVKANQPMRLGVKVKRIALMEKPPRFSKGLIAGWGWIDEDKETSSNYLKFVEQILWSQRKCMKLINDRPYIGVFCAAANDSINYPSGGDSGSPLVINDYIQVGLVSFKIPIIRNVIVYTNVSYFYQWIVENIMQMTCEKLRK